MPIDDLPIIFDGIDLLTGEPKTPPMTGGEAGEYIYANILANQAILQGKRGIPSAPSRGFTVSRPWGLVVPTSIDPKIKEDLNPLVEWRGGQILPYDGELTLSKWRRNLPPEIELRGSWYLLLLGGPEQIRYDFEKTLTPIHLVGRLYFDEALVGKGAYKRYVQTLLAFEQKQQVHPQPRPGMDLFAPDGDAITSSSCEHLARPLQNALADQFEVTAFLGEDASKQKVLQRMRTYPQRGAAAVTFLLSHGAIIEEEYHLRNKYQGSWVPQRSYQYLEEASEKEICKHLITFHDFLSGEHSPCGSIVFNYACFGAGIHGETNLREFFLKDLVEPSDPHPIVSSIGQCLLGNPKPALGYIGTLDSNVNIYTLLPHGQALYIGFLKAVLTGSTVGLAFQDFRIQAVASKNEAEEISEDLLEARLRGEQITPERMTDLAYSWLTGQTLENTVLLGDPQACLYP